MEREALYGEGCKLVGQPNKFRFTLEVTPANSTVPSQRVDYFTFAVVVWSFYLS